MKFSYEMKVGLLGLIALLLLIWGVPFLKGRNIFKRPNYVYVEYDNVGGLAISAPVTVSGFQVGTVSDIYLKEDGSGKVMVVIDFNSGFQVARNAVAQIGGSNPLSGKSIFLYTPEPKAKEMAMAGDTLRGSQLGMLESMLGFDPSPTIDKAKNLLGKADSSFTAKFGDMGDDIKTTMLEMEKTIANLSAITSKVSTLLDKSSSAITNSLGNVETITNNFKKDNSKITQILDNANQTTEKLKNVELNQTVDRLNATLKSFETVVDQAKGTLSTVNGLVAKANSKEGSIGLLLNDTELYDNLNHLSSEFSLLSQDFRLNPKRYVNVSVFGKKQKDYVCPTNDCANPPSNK